MAAASAVRRTKAWRAATVCSGDLTELTSRLAGVIAANRWIVLSCARDHQRIATFARAERKRRLGSAVCRMKYLRPRRENNTRRSVMRITIRRIACVVAVAAAPLAACDAAKSTRPGVEPATSVAGSTVEVQPPAGEALRSCPEIRIPELLCRSDLPAAVNP
jgi:hypothetical protein